MNSVLERFNKIQADITKQTASLKETVKIIAVSKTFSIDHISPLVDEGHTHFGENKVQEAEKKWSSLKKEKVNLKLHMLGKLQTNKVKKAVSIFDYIHSLDNIKLADTLKKNEVEMGRKLSYFMQVNFENEKQKLGLSVSDVPSFFEYCKNKIGLNIVGTMCFPPFETDPEIFFKKAYELNKSLKLNELSMGMSNDYSKAIKYGTTFVRVGSAIFGERNI